MAKNVAHNHAGHPTAARQMQEAQTVNTARTPGRNHRQMLWSAYCLQEPGIRPQSLPPKCRP
eukprot:11176206-Lingulodinium_polyedra.AAC.1